MSGVFGGVAHAATFIPSLDFGRPANANPWGIATMRQTGSPSQMRVRVAEGDSLAHNGTSWATTTTGGSVTSARYTTSRRGSQIVGQYQSRLNANVTWRWYHSIIR